MLESLFLQILNMSFSASIVILILLVVRLLLRRAPRAISYGLWAVALFRLLCPLRIESVLSLFPANPQPIPQGILLDPAPQVDTGLPVVNQVINPILPAPAVGDSVNPLQVWVWLGSLLWVAGIAALLLYSVVSLLRLRRRLAGATQAERNLYLVAGLETPFVLGLLRPKIYLPAGLGEQETGYILLHEQTHIRRGDHLFKLLGFLALCIHWFNPLAWVAFALFEQDMEASCDERVIRQLGSGVKQAYSASLLSLATGRRWLGGAPLAFGEGDTKSRIKNVLRYRKPALWVAVAAVVVAVAIGAGLALDPAAASQPPSDLFAQAEQFSTAETEPLAIGREALLHYYETFMGEAVPEEYRITSFSLQSLSLRAGDANEFAIDCSFALSTDGNYFLAGEGVPYGDRPGGECPSVYRQLRVKALGGGQYQIVELGTGGADQGLQLVAFPAVLRQAFPEPYVIEADGDILLGEEPVARYYVSLTGVQRDETALLVGVNKTTGQLLLHDLNAGRWIPVDPETAPEEAFIRAVLASRTFSGGELRFTLPPVIPQRYTLDMEISALVPSTPGSTRSIDILGTRNGNIAWEAGKSYSEQVFTGEIPDKTQLSFKVAFTRPFAGAEEDAGQEQVCWGYSQWVFADGQPNELVRCGLTTATVQQPTGPENQAAVEYYENDGGAIRLGLSLPAGWSLQTGGEGLPLGFPFGQVNLLDGSGSLAGTLSYTQCDDLTGYATPGEERFRVALFNELMLGSLVNWNNDYTPVTQTQTNGVATCRLWWRDSGEEWAGRMAEAPEHYAPGILAYDTTLGRSFAVQFTENALTDAQLRQLAESISIDRLK